MTTEARMPVPLDEMTRALADVTTVTDARKLLAKIDSATAITRAAGMFDATQNLMELRLRTERKAGGVLGPADGSGRPPKNLQRESFSESENVRNHRWRKIAGVPDASFERYLADKREARDEITTAGLLRPDTSNLQSSESNEWYTPTQYIEAARNVMGAIDVDPASSDLANEIVQAATYYTKDDDGLTEDWPGRVWLNPPYGGLSAPFVDRLVQQFEERITVEAVCLVNSHATDTAWFRPLWDHVLCFTDHRIDFRTPSDAVKSTSTHGSVLVYLGDKRQAFAREFAPFGAVVTRYV